MQLALNKAFREVASPAYIFSAQAFAARAKMVKEAFGEGTAICFSIKANPFLLSVLPDEFSKIEVCSPGELEICETLNVPGKMIIYSGVNKGADDIEEAIRYGAGVLTAESLHHMELIQAVSEKLNLVTDVLPRLNSDMLLSSSRSLYSGRYFSKESSLTNASRYVNTVLPSILPGSSMRRCPGSVNMDMTFFLRVASSSDR